MSRLTVALLVLIAIAGSLSFIPHAARAYMNPCCEYAIYSTDIQPKPGERVDLTGVVTDRWGGGQAGVAITYSDAGNYQTNSTNATTDAHGAWHLSIKMPPVTIQYPMKFAIAMNDSAQGWTTTLADSYSYISSSGDVPGIYESDFSGRLNAYINIQSVGLPMVIFLSGGYLQPLLSGDNQLDQNTLNFLETISSAGYNVIAPIGWFVQTQPIFPFLLASLAKYGLGFSSVYLIGWSAGGTVAAWTLTNDNYQLFDLGVIMDAELQGASNSTQTDATVFKTATLSNRVKVPHLLIWGSGDSGSISIQSALAWVHNAQSDLVRLDAFPYTHVWLGTPVQAQIQEDIFGFFKQRFVGTFTSLESGNITVQFLANGQVNPSKTTYDPTNKAFTIQITQPNGTIGSLNAVVPMVALDGQPVVTVDNNTSTALSVADGNSYRIYLTYPQGRHVILIEGQNSVAEFTGPPTQLIVLAASMLSLLLVSTTTSRRRPIKDR